MSAILCVGGVLLSFSLVGFVDRIRLSKARGIAPMGSI
jgi:hypothetical protein